MGARELQTKKETIAGVLNGKIIDDTGRVAVSIKGVIDGFPATLEAIYPTWPFGVMYSIETGAAVNHEQESGRITIYPRVGRGLMSIVTKVIMFEGGGMPVNNKQLDGAFNFNYDNQQLAERFAQHHGISELLFALDDLSKFSEVIIKTDKGLYLSNSTNFNALDPEICRNIFQTMAAVGKVLSTAF